MVQVGEHQGGRAAGLAAAFQFGRHQAFPVAAVEEPGKAVLPAVAFQFVVLAMQLAQRQACRVADGQRLHKECRHARQGDGQPALRLPSPTEHQHPRSHTECMGQQAAPQQTGAATCHGVHAHQSQRRGAGHHAERHQCRPGAAEQVVDQQVPAFGFPWVGRGQGQAPGKLRPDQTVEQRAQPHPGWCLLDPQHRADRQRSKQQADAARHTVALGKAEVGSVGGRIGHAGRHGQRHGAGTVAGARCASHRSSEGGSWGRECR